MVRYRSKSISDPLQALNRQLLYHVSLDRDVEGTLLHIEMHQHLLLGIRVADGIGTVVHLKHMRRVKPVVRGDGLRKAGQNR